MSPVSFQAVAFLAENPVQVQSAVGQYHSWSHCRRVATRVPLPTSSFEEAGLCFSTQSWLPASPAGADVEAAAHTQQDQGWGLLALHEHSFLLQILSSMSAQNLAAFSGWGLLPTSCPTHRHLFAPPEPAPI